MAQTESESSPDLGELLVCPDELPAEGEDFRITSVELAAWAARKVLAARTRMERRATLAAQYTQRIAAWLGKANADDRGSVEFLTSHLKPFAQSEIAKQRRLRTLHLPGAAVSLRKKPDRVDVFDPEALLAYCEASYPEALVVTTSVSTAKVLARIKKEGELPPGVDFSRGEDELYVRPDSEGPGTEGAIDAVA